MFVGYTRVSTVEQAGPDRTSLKDQEQKIRGFAMMSGVDAFECHIFRDGGVSGATPLENRPAGAELLSSLSSGDIVVASKLDRMFRSALDALATAKHFKKIGVDLILLDMGTSPVTKDGMAECFFTMAAAFAQLERVRIAERMADGRKAKKAKGGHLGGQAPYGFRVEGKGLEATLVPDEEEQAKVEKIRELLRYYRKPYRVKKALAKKGILTRAGTPFSLIQILRIAPAIYKNHTLRH